MVKVYSCRFFLLFLALCGLIPVWAEKNKGNLSNLVCFVRFLDEDNDEMFERPFLRTNSCLMTTRRGELRIQLFPRGLRATCLEEQFLPGSGGRPGHILSCQPGEGIL